MPERPEPYLTHARPARWSGWTLLAPLVLWGVYYINGKDPTWERPLFFVFGLILLAVGIDALRTSEASFDWGVWIHWRAERSERPTVFWSLTLVNLVLGARVIGLSLFAEAP